MLVARRGGVRSRRAGEAGTPVRRTITRPAVSTERLSLTPQGNIRYRLKTPYRDGTTDGVFEPLELSLAGWPPWCRRRASTSPVTTGSLRRTTDGVNK